MLAIFVPAAQKVYINFGLPPRITVILNCLHPKQISKLVMFTFYLLHDCRHLCLSLML